MPAGVGVGVITEGFLEEVIFDLVSNGKNLSVQREKFNGQSGWSQNGSAHTIICGSVCLVYFTWKENNELRDIA